MEEKGIKALPPETLSQVFQNLQGDSRSLYACALVNRKWCRQVIPILWSFPLRFGFVKNSSGHFIQSLLSCIEHEDRESLRQVGIRLSRRKKPLFEYATFLREFDFKALDVKVTTWYQKYSSCLPHTDTVASQSFENAKNARIAIVTTILSKLIISRSPFMTKFWLTKRNAMISTQSLPDFTTFDGIESALKRVDSVYFHTDFEELDEQDETHVNFLLSAMKVLSRNIGHLEVEFGDCTDNFERQIADLIKLQKGLRSVVFYNISSQQTSVLNALTYQANSLTRVEFRDSSLEGMTIAPLTRCTNLDTLVFDETEDMPDNFWQPLLFPGPCRLKRLHFRDNKSYGNAMDLATLIQKAGRHLNELQLIQPSINPVLLHYVAQFCPNFTHLDVQADASLSTSLLHIMSSCDRLTYFSLRRDDNDDMDCENFLPKLGQVLPPSVRHVNLYFAVTPAALKKFLESYGKPLRKLGINQVDGLSNYILRVLADYATRIDVSRDLEIGIDDPSAVYKCDNGLVEKLKTLCRFVNVSYPHSNQVPSF